MFLALSWSSVVMVCMVLFGCQVIIIISSTASQLIQHRKLALLLQHIVQHIGFPLDFTIWGCVKLDKTQQQNLNYVWLQTYVHDCKGKQQLKKECGKTEVDDDSDPTDHIKRSSLKQLWPLSCCRAMTSFLQQSFIPGESTSCEASSWETN